MSNTKTKKWALLGSLQLDKIRVLNLKKKKTVLQMEMRRIQTCPEA